MKIFYPPRFKARLANCPNVVQRKFYKQAGYLLQSIRHPSLNAKKYDESTGVWQARVDRNFRFYFLIAGDTYILLSIGPHPK